MTSFGRRRCLAAGAVALAGVVPLAGCSGALGSDEPPTLTVSNERGEAVELRLQVTRLDPGTVVFDESASLEAGASRSFTSDLEPGTEYQIVVTTADGRLAGRTTYEAGATVEIALAADGVTVSQTTN